MLICIFIYLYTDVLWYGEGPCTTYTSYLLTTSPNLMYIMRMKQPSMFHKGERGHYRSSDDDIYDRDFDNTICPIFDAIQKQRAKQRATLPRNSISDPVGVMVHQYIKIAGVKARPAKRILA